MVRVCRIRRRFESERSRTICAHSATVLARSTGGNNTIQISWYISSISRQRLRRSFKDVSPGEKASAAAIRCSASRLTKSLPCNPARALAGSFFGRCPKPRIDFILLNASSTANGDGRLQEPDPARIGWAGSSKQRSIARLATSAAKWVFAFCWPFARFSFALAV